MKQRKILVLDDHSLYLKGMVHLLKEILPECDVISCTSIKELERDKQRFEIIDLLISDIELPGEDIFDLFNFIKKEYPQLPILVISMHKKIAVIRKCKMLGVEGYILKDEDELLAEAISKTINGEIYYSPKVEMFFRKATSTLQKLSLREDTIIKLIAQGFGNKEIAEQLFISVETVKTHKKNIKLKLGLNSTYEFINYAKSNFLL